VLVPWDKVRSVRHASGQGSAMINFELAEESVPTQIRHGPIFETTL
jgi:hypothetical protein